MRAIVTDERRCAGPKSARRCTVTQRSLLEGVASLARATSPRGALLLPSRLLWAITMPPPDQGGL